MEPIYAQPAELLQDLIRIDTTNPPGSEVLSILHIHGLLKDAGIQTPLVVHTPYKKSIRILL